MAERREVASLWSSTGEFCPLSDQQFAALTDDEKAAYRQVFDASLKCTEADRLVAEATKQCTEAVAEMRTIESSLALAPKTTFMDAWRAMRDAG